MNAALSGGDETEWRQQAHAFKGVCMNLGANPLSELCARAQMDWRAPEEDKRAMLQSIENEMVNVRRILDQQTKA
jgi:HPt (histidine-containing phosphotransfer) domain-containing protein